MSIREEVEKLVEAAEGNITAEHVVEQAKDKETFPALHKHLWEVSEADLAAEARISRAHRLLITVRVVTGEGETTRMLVHTRGVPGYRPLSSIVTNPDLAASKLTQLTEDIARARGRLRAFRAAIHEDIADAIDEALETAEAKAKEAVAERTEPAEAAA